MRRLTATVAVQTGFPFHAQVWASNYLFDLFSFNGGLFICYDEFTTTTRQFWFVPFVTDGKRKSFLKKVVEDVELDIAREK